jgi:hypothetical protein
MIFLIPGFSALIFSLGISSQILGEQHQKFKNLNYRSTTGNCDISDVFSPYSSLGSDKEGQREKCLWPDLSAHADNYSTSARDLIYIAVESCKKAGCNEY